MDCSQQEEGLKLWKIQSGPVGEHGVETHEKSEGFCPLHFCSLISMGKKKKTLTKQTADYSVPLSLGKPDLN